MNTLGQPTKQFTPVGANYARLLRIKEVAHKTGLSRSKLYDLIGTGRFPAPVKFGERVSLWPESEVNQWIDALVKKNREVLA